MEGNNPVNAKPYKYDVMEKLVREMLDSKVIQPSTSLFASHVILVKKKDGSWRFCVNYRKLNSFTIKNKFPIPLIEELIDELHGVKYFTRLDLRSDYH